MDKQRRETLQQQEQQKQGEQSDNTEQGVKRKGRLFQGHHRDARALTLLDENDP